MRKVRLSFQPVFKALGDLFQHKLKQLRQFAPRATRASVDRFAEFRARNCFPHHLVSPSLRKSRRALLTHRAPTLDSDEEPLLRPRMQDAWEWQVPVCDRLHSGPRYSAPLAAAHEGAVPAFDHVMPEC